MSSIQKMRTAAGARRIIVGSGVMLGLGLIGAIALVVLAVSETPGTGSGQGAVQGGLVVVSAILAGAGVVMLATGLNKVRDTRLAASR
jgi:hypothetical protein